MPVAENADIVLYHAPRTRAFRMLWLLEELDRPYRIKLMSLAAGDHKTQEFLQLNPMGKVPLIVDEGMAITETGAMMVHLADKYSPGELAPLFKEREQPDPTTGSCRTRR